VATPTLAGSTLLIDSVCRAICPVPWPMDFKTDASRRIKRLGAMPIRTIDPAVRIRAIFTIRLRPCLSTSLPTKRRRTKRTIAPREKKRLTLAIFLSSPSKIRKELTIPLEKENIPPTMA